VETQLSFYALRGWLRVLRDFDQFAIDLFWSSNLKPLMAYAHGQLGGKKAP